MILGSPVTRWASVAFGAGVGIGSAYTDCSHLFDGSPAKITESPAPPQVIPSFYFIFLFKFDAV